MPDYEFEKAAVNSGFSCICGVDEAGRGPLAGPVCAAAVILPAGAAIEGLDDSKKLTEKKRERLYDIIKQTAVAYSVAYGTLEEIETVNILEATYLAMNRAIEGLTVKPDFALIDGNRVPRGIKIPCETIVKGASKSMSRRLRCSQRSRVTALCLNTIKNTPSITLKSTRATAQRSTQN